MKQNILLTAICLALTGCGNTPPSPKFDVNNPVQVSLDYLQQTRHFTNKDVYFSHSDQFADMRSLKKNAVIIESRNWSQAMVRVDGINSKSDFDKLQLEDNLSRTCWANRNDASVTMTSTSIRGVKNQNNLNACISSRLGQEFPLFVYSWVTDPVIGEYFMIVSPTDDITNAEYICKLQQEGYNFKTFTYCG